jgi:hypothetical protein
VQLYTTSYLSPFSHSLLHKLKSENLPLKFHIHKLHASTIHSNSSFRNTHHFQDLPTSISVKLSYQSDRLSCTKPEVENTYQHWALVGTNVRLHAIARDCANLNVGQDGRCSVSTLCRLQAAGYRIRLSLGNLESFIS